MTKFPVASPDPFLSQGEHDERLNALVRPTDHKNPRPAGTYNLVVVGAGTAGLVAAVGAAGMGAKVALIERDRLGGDCLNVGCVPSKALIRCARAAHEARSASRFGVRVSGEAQVDFAAVMDRMRALRADIAKHDSVERMTELGIDVYLGEARFTGEHQVEVAGSDGNSQQLEFKKACIATGTHPVDPPINGLQDAGFVTNESLFSLTEMPARFGVIGGGPIGAEMAQAFARFGAEVHLIQAGERILAKESEEVSGFIERKFAGEGITVHTDSRLEKVEVRGSEKILHLVGGDGSEKVAVDQVLVSVGRAPNVRDLGLEVAGVEFDERHGVRVDDHLRTSNRDIFAAGDVCTRHQFTHTADAQARIVLRNALFLGRSKTSDLIIPWCTYTDPEIGHVGLLVSEAEKQGIEHRVHRIELKDVHRARLDGEDEGWLEIVAKPSGKILGATVVAAHAGDLMGELSLAMTVGAGLDQIAGVIHPYPTQAEVIKKAGDAYMRTKLTPLVKKWSTRWLRWRR